MAKFCLLKSEVQNFRKALISGAIDPAKLAEMTSTDRRNFLSKYVGEKNSQQVNALFESKLLLKNQKAGYISWAKKVSGITKEARRDLISRIERMERVLDPKEEDAFLNDLATARLGIEVTYTEAKNIATLSKLMQEKRTKANTDGKFKNDDERLAFGLSAVRLENYINELKLKSQKISLRNEPIRAIGKSVKESPGLLKSLVASLDNSFFGRQGIKALMDVRTAPIWTKNFLKSWVDISRELRGIDALDLIRADIYSRENALNGKYRMGRYGLDVLTEEAYPSTLPQKIPVLKRLYKASESAYNGGALRMRADLADRIIALAEKQGINTLNREEAEGMGTLISSLTGRGGLGKAETLSKEINVLMFSIKFLKANIDTLTAHTFDPKSTKFSRKEARKNLISMIASIGSILTIANLLNPDSVEEDPRSSNFGKIKLFGRWVDITGGMGGLVTLASRTLVPTYHNGKLSLWKKSTTGKYTDLLSGEYGSQDAFDLLVEGLFANKLSPIAGIMRDVWRGENFDGERMTPTLALKTAIIPITADSIWEMMNDPKSTSPLASSLLEVLGFSGSSYTEKSNWEMSTSKEMEQFRNKVGEDKFKKANEEFNKAYDIWITSTEKTDEYKSLSEDNKSKLKTKAKKEIKEGIYKRYRFKYKETKKTSEEKKQDKLIERLSPRT